MRILLDESLPRQLAAELIGHDVATAAQLGWAGISNGELLRRLESAGFQALLTADQSLQYQQNVAGAAVAVVVLKARTNRVQDVVLLVPSIMRVLAFIEPGQVIRVER